MIGTLLGARYRLQTLLGQGGMGSVYAALDEATGQRVAVKILHAEAVKDASSRDDTSKLVRFQREAKAASGVSSRHIARVSDFGTDQTSGQAFMVMELLEGEDLQQVLKRVEVLPPDVALRIAAQACQGLADAHEARIMHRDIKPANLFLARSPTGEITVKLLDFGIAKIRPDSENDGETTGLTRTGSMLGSPRYMSPEQARGRRSLDHRTDLWSLGVVLYRALSGHMPHEDAEAVGEFIVMLCSEPPKPVETFAPWVPAEIGAIVEGALQIDRENRYETALVMLDAMRALLPRGEGVRVEELTPVPEAMRGSAAPRPAGSGTTTGPSNDKTMPLPTGRVRRAAGQKDDITTPNTLANTQVEAAQAPRRRAAPFAVAGAIVALGLLAFAAVRGMDMFSTPAAPGSASGTAAASAATRRANLVIFPSDASVEIDGARAAAHDGIVELEGKLGSVHRVRIEKDGQGKTVEVVLGEAGAEPPKVELSLADAAPSATVSATASASGHAAPGTKKTGAPPATGPAVTATATATATRKNPLIPERFE